MSFIAPDEYFLLMDYVNADGELMNDDDLSALYSAGIHTSVMFTSPWSAVEPKMGKYNWSSIDRYLERVGRHGYKSLIACYSEGPRWLPLEWCAQTATGVQPGVISPWSAEGVAYQLGFYQAMHDRYTIPGVAMVYNSWITNGETLFLNEPGWYGPEAARSYREFTQCDCEPTARQPETDEWFRQTLIDLLIKQQSILVDNPDREIWTAAHPVLAQIYGNGNIYMEDYLQACQKQLSPCEINHIYYTWLSWPGIWDYIESVKERYHESQWGGAEYCEGLLQTTPHGISSGLRGHIICPCHPYTGHAHVEPWMIKRIEWSMGEWAKAHTV